MKHATKEWFPVARVSVLLLLLPLFVEHSSIISRMAGMPGNSATRAGSGFAGSVHDFSRRPHPNGQPASNSCVFCHVESSGAQAVSNPRELRLALAPALIAGNSFPPSDRYARGDAAVTLRRAYSPLWNSELAGTYTSYAMYQNGPGAPRRGAKASQAIATGMAPGSTSLLCLGCHDGSVAINRSGNTIGEGNYLGNHHPIGFDYDAVQAEDREIRAADIATLGGAGVVREHLYGPGNTTMECGTCHSVHNTGNTGERLLWRSDIRSRLCLTCHNKGTDTGAGAP